MTFAARFPRFLRARSLSLEILLRQLAEAKPKFLREYREKSCWQSLFNTKMSDQQSPSETSRRPRGLALGEGPRVEMTPSRRSEAIIGRVGALLGASKVFK